MTLRRKMVRAQLDVDPADDRTVTVTVSTEDIGRDGLVVMTGGIRLDNYRSNPVILWQHNPDWPIARADEITAIGTDLVARAKFPAAGVSNQADESLGLIRAGVISAASIGFDDVEGEPIDAAKPRDGTRVLACELVEFSFVSIPALPTALVTERAADLSDEEQEAVAQSIVKLKRGIVTRGMYGVGQLAYILEELGWVKTSAEWEAEYEADGSQVPAMLGAALKSLGEALIAMTTEEVNELIGTGEDVDVEPVTLDVEEVGIVTNASGPQIARFRLGARRCRMLATRQKTAKPSELDQRKAYRQRMAKLYAKELAATAG